MKKLFKPLMAVIMASTLMHVGVTPVLAAPQIEKVESDGRGVVEIDFAGRVQYKKLKVSVKDNTGKKYTTTIIDKDNDELDFKIKKYKAGKTYTYTISGIREKGEKKYGKIKGKVKIPKKTSAVKVKTVEFDSEDNELDFEFTKAIHAENPSIKITRGNTEYTAYVTDIGDDDMEVYVKGLKRGKTYKYTISGVRAATTQKTTSISGEFTA